MKNPYNLTWLDILVYLIIFSISVIGLILIMGG